MSAVDLRRMRWWDIPAVMGIEEEVFPATAWSPAQFWSELAHEDRTYVVAEEAGAAQEPPLSKYSDRIVGYGGVMTRPPTADIQTIAVHPECRGRGVARMLLSCLLETAEGTGCTEVLLEVAADNAPALALYESEGFEVIARRSSYYGPGMDALIMRRRRS